MKKLLLLDIDYTIFDTDIYRDKLYTQLAKKLGVTVDEFNHIAAKAYKQTKEQEGYFNPQIYLELLSTYGNNAVTKSMLEDVFWKNDLYTTSLEENVVTVLRKLKERNIEIGILSTGQTQHQQKKIESIKEYLSSEHIHIFPDKLKEIEKIINEYAGYQIYVVDDLPVVLSQIKKISPSIVTIWKKVEKRYETTEMIESFNPDFTITHVDQIMDIL